MKNVFSTCKWCKAVMTSDWGFWDVSLKFEHFTVIIFRPVFRLEMPPRIIVVRREVGFSTSRRMTDMDPPVPCFAIVEGYGPL